MSLEAKKPLSKRALPETEGLEAKAKNISQIIHSSRFPKEFDQQLWVRVEDAQAQIKQLTETLLAQKALPKNVEDAAIEIAHGLAECDINMLDRTAITCKYFDILKPFLVEVFAETKKLEGKLEAAQQLKETFEKISFTNFQSTQLLIAEFLERLEAALK